ncbi:MAG: hypothetical protein WDO24_24595, partial [Pseudomonadota bacterium]
MLCPRRRPRQPAAPAAHPDADRWRARLALVAGAGVYWFLTRNIETHDGRVRRRRCDADRAAGRRAGGFELHINDNQRVAAGRSVAAARSPRLYGGGRERARRAGAAVAQVA